MPKYNSLLLNLGGGIINKNQQSPQYTGSAALIIGIGGTGTAAVAELKKKIFQQLLPDNPGSPVPQYDHIQLLAIDSDDSKMQRGGSTSLNPASEFFKIKNDNLGAMLGGNGKAAVEKDPRFNWMDIGGISKLLTPEGAGGIRQVGRYLLISRAQELYNSILKKCQTALKGRGTSSLDIYICAGLSGGTGSGCFVDTCYIVQKVLHDNGWQPSSKIMGFFFLPDVVTNKPELVGDHAVKTWNDNNGYAALKELDYLMDLKGAHDHFFQNYGTFTIDTQEPPVDMCYLVSSVKSDGSVLTDGFTYCINVVADYVMSYLADVNLGGVAAGGDGDKGLTMRGHLSNVANGVALLQRDSGASRSYHVLGASNAEIPMTQIATYLAAGFDAKFHSLVGRDKYTLTKEDVNRFAQKIGLTVSRLASDLQKGLQTLMLPDIDKGVLRKYGPMAVGTFPSPWATAGNSWYDSCIGTREKHRAAMNGKLETFEPDKVPTDSLLGRVFQELATLCKDPQHGPYYAAAMLGHQGYDLFSVIEGLIKEAGARRDTASLQLEGHNADGLRYQIVQASTDFCNPGIDPLDPFGNKKYARYKALAEEIYRYNNEVSLYGDMIKLLQNFREMLRDFRKAYYEPLIRMLDTLHETFIEDALYLQGNGAALTAGFTWQILSLEDVEKPLKDSLEELTPNALVLQFMDNVLNDPDAWQSGDENKIVLFVSQYMVKVFAKEMNRSLQDYLFEKFPQAAGDVAKLQELVEQEIIQHAYDSSLPMFWCDPLFAMGDPTNVFSSSTLSVPSAATAICAAASKFSETTKGLAVRQTGLQDRIFALRFYSGIPLYAYNGILRLKEEYDGAANTTTGVGAHLYSATHRGEDGTGELDWRKLLPAPVPYSKSPEANPDGRKAIEVYDKAVKAGVIYQETTGAEPVDNGTDTGKSAVGTKFVIRLSRSFELPEYSIKDFMEGRVFLTAKYEKAMKTLNELRETLYTGDAKEIPMRNDGNPTLGAKVVEAVRKDYFIHYPRLQQLVEDELKKLGRLNAMQADLKKIKADYDGTKVDVSNFCRLIIYKKLCCTDTTDNEDYKVIAKVQYNYTAGGMKKSLILSDFSMEYGSNYPLYQAYLTYCGLDPEAMPRREMDKKAAECKTAPRTEDVIQVACTLFEKWNDTALQELEEETSRRMSAEVHNHLMDFYYCLFDELSDFRRTTANWPSSKSASTNGGMTPPPPPPAPKQEVTYWVWSSTTGRQMTAKSSTPWYALDTAINDWVKLDPATMQVYNAATGGWVPLKLDDNGNILL